jgi:hypothetical protein
MVFVSVLSQGGSSGYNAQTDVAGRATFFVAGKVTKVTAHPFASGRDVLNADVPVEGDPDDFRLVLRKKATIQGTVLGEDGQPLGECWIAAKRDGKNIATARPAADGTFSLDVPQDESFDVEFMGVATARGAIEQEAFAADPVRARSGATGVQLRVRRLEADRTLRVRVVFPDGTPAAGVPVFAGLATGNTGDDGVAELKSLVAREISVRASLPRGRTDVLWPLPTKVVPAGQEVTLKLRKTVAITGVVLLPDGTAAAGAIVQVPGIAGVATDAEGRFTVRVPADEPGPWTLVAEIRDKKLSGEVGEVRTGAAGVQIVLR